MGKGTEQVSTLSTPLFLLVMDPLLTCLQDPCLSLPINNYAGGFTQSSSESLIIYIQVSIVERFSEEHFLKS